MITSAHLMTYVKAEPFRPFRLHMASGKTFEVRHPEMIKVLKTVLLVFSFNAGGTELTDKMESVSLMLIESVSHIDAAVGA
jgi:hypothetical protein